MIPKRKILVSSLIISGIAISAPIYALSVEDYCDPAVCAPKGIKAITPMSDGITYTAISDNGKKIEVYSYKTGKVLKTLFDVDAVKGDIKIDSFAGYTISQNEKKILLWNNIKSIYRRSFTADYYVYDILRGTLKKVSEQGRQRDAVISHDGRMVAYTRDNNIFISNLDYDTDYAVTTDGKINNIINGSADWSYEEEFSLVNTIRWSSDDNTLAFVKFDESDVPVYRFDQYKSYCEQDPLSDLYPSDYSYKYPLAGYPNSRVSVHSFNLDTRITKTMDLPVDSQYIPSIEFDGKGENLMVMLLNRDQNDLRLYRVNPGSTVAHLVMSEKSDAWLSPSAYQMVKYFDNSFVIGSERSGYRHLYEYDYNGNLLRQISKGDWNVTDYYGKDTANRHFFQSTFSGPVNRCITVVDSKGNANIISPKEGTEYASFSTTMQYFVGNYSNSTTPNRYSIFDNNGKKMFDLEDNSKYSAKYASAPRKEFLKVRNAVGEDMDAYIIKPADFNESKKYPLLMYQYNGPDSQEVLNRWKMEGVYYLASQGYIVACVDGRGTGNRNRAWSTSVYMQLGKLETEDQIAGAKYFASLPYIDVDKVACFGWSYGGYMTLMELSEKNTPFKAGVAMAPVTDWRFYDSIYTERYMKTPQQNEKGYDNASALLRSEDMDASLLIMSGTSDDNVHYYNTLKYTSKLNYEGKIFDMMSFTGFEHSLPMCNARVQLFKKVKSFLDINIK
ncbi:MAG: S9 family peptidase [Muribaculaceae bacterium]|nr:S9 family peptidase [Muribaculaceae bacterium]